MLKCLVDLDWSTILYHVSNLGQTLPQEAFTNHYHRDEGLTIELSIMHQVAGWATVIRVDNVENRKNTRCGLNGGGRYRKDFSDSERSVGKQFETHGGRFGRAMIKYPLYKKNNSRKITPAYPGWATVSLDR